MADNDRPTDDRPCRCPEVKVGGTPTGTRNWNPDCPIHDASATVRHYQPCECWTCKYAPGRTDG